MKLFPAKEEKVLKQLLACAVDLDEVFSLASLHGYLYCLALIPEAIVPSEWLPDVFGEEMFELEDQDQADRLFAGLMAVYNRFMEEGNNDRLRFPFHLEKLKGWELEQLRDWAYGFFLATRLRPEVWGLPDEDEDFPELDDEEFSDEEQEIAASMMVLMGVAFPEQIPDILEPAGEDVEDPLAQLSPLEQEARFLSLLPLAVNNFQEIANEVRDNMFPDRAGISSAPTPQRRAEKIGRNDPCPCGSGKKYKKCCGSN